MSRKALSCFLLRTDQMLLSFCLVKLQNSQSLKSTFTSAANFLQCSPLFKQVYPASRSATEPSSRESCSTISQPAKESKTLESQQYTKRQCLIVFQTAPNHMCRATPIRHQHGTLHSGVVARNTRAQECGSCSERSQDRESNNCLNTTN